MDSSETSNSRQNSTQDDMDDNPKQIPYRRDRTPSIVVQSLGLSFNKDSAITGSIELPENDQPSANSSDQDDEDEDELGKAPRDESERDLDIRDGLITDSGNFSPTSQAKMLLNRQQLFQGKQNEMAGVIGASRRLSLNIVSNAPRRQSLTVDGLSSSASFVNPSGNATGSLRNKVALKPGHSLMGWIKLAAAASDLAGTGGVPMEVTPEELAKHDNEKDCWVALKGNVYNVTTYLNFHPGGVEELMRGAGRDATDLFNEVHRWVNYESILAKCLVGPYKLDSPLTPKGRATFKTISENSTVNVAQATNEIKSSNDTATTNTQPAAPKRRDPTVAQRPDRRQSIALTVPTANKYQSLLLNNNSSNNLNQVQQPPTYVISQDKSSIKLKIQDLSTLPSVRSRHLICDLNQQMDLHVSVILSHNWLYRVHLHLDQEVERRLNTNLVNANATTNGFEEQHHQIMVQLNKKEQVIWNKIGTSLDLNDSLCEMTLADKYFRPCQLVTKTKLTHDTYLFEFKLKQTLMYVPISWHVLIREYQPNSNNCNSKTKSEDQQQQQASTYDDRIYKNYTPVLASMSAKDRHGGLTDESGFMSSLYFIIKIYQDGVVTGKLDQLQVGDMVDISDYQCVDYDIEQLVASGTRKRWVMLAAGTGITPFCRTIAYLLEQPDTQIESITLLYFNKTQDDIIWRKEFENLAQEYEDKFDLVHVLSNEPELPQPGVCKWSGKRGRISRELLADHVDKTSPDELQILACGPRPFTQMARSFISDLNLTEKLYVFHG